MKTHTYTRTEYTHARTHIHAHQKGVEKGGGRRAWGAKVKKIFKSLRKVRFNHLFLTTELGAQRILNARNLGCIC